MKVILLEDVKSVGKKGEIIEVNGAFGAVSSKEIATEIKSQLGIDIDKKKINLSAPIKSVGSFDVQIKLHPKVTGEIKVKVVGKD